MLDYDNSACYQLETNLEDNRDIITSTNSRTGYFQKVCLRAPACEKAWIYERTVGYLLEGEDDRVIAGVESRTGCEELCLLELEFTCASAEYFYDLAECRLSRQTRRSRPASFRAGTENVDYLENQCVRERLPPTCRPDLYENQDFGYADIDISVNSAEEVKVSTVKYKLLPDWDWDISVLYFLFSQCEAQCDQTVAFNCRSFTYLASSGSCRLSSDDTSSAGPGALTVRQGAMFYQRTACVERE